MIRIRFRLGPVIWEPRHTPDRRPAVGHATRKDGLWILALLGLFLACLIVGTVLSYA